MKHRHLTEPSDTISSPTGPHIHTPTYDVAVISHNEVGNFGDRLGFHIVNSLLPETSIVHHLTFSTLHTAKDRYDLVVVGIGNSIFHPLLRPDLFEVIDRGRAAVGIFGTQYRELIC
ncbi:hypothetical protein, partial [Bradyrhizobium sp. STM 3809]|uniref:hypothetical protein n=1 Tax=Bradyrhizobium sp. STM 3809 TaxID=551936 RepID=UPI00054E32AA